MADFVAGRGTEALGIIGTSAGGLALFSQFLGALGRAATQGSAGQQAAPAMPTMPTMPNIIVLGDTGSSRSSASGTDTVSKETFDLALRLSNSERDNAILTAELNTEKKMVEVYNALNDKINQLVNDQAAINSAQAVNNCATASQLAVLNSTTAQIMGLTKLVVPNGSICPGWGDATVTVSTSTAVA